MPSVSTHIGVSAVINLHVVELVKLALNRILNLVNEFVKDMLVVVL